MVIDVHGHVVASPLIYSYREFLIGTRGSYGKAAGLDFRHGRHPDLPDELIEEYVQTHIRQLDEVSTDLQLISSRPYGLMHSEKPAKIVHWWAEAINNVIGAQARLHPEKFRGMVNLPQIAGESPAVTFDEIDRCVNDVGGFVGVLLNPDPGEGDEKTPPMGDEYWYPLYEKLEKMDLPAHIHSTACKNFREPQSFHFIREESLAILSLIESRVFQDFPNLKIVISHAGGAIPYQVARFRGVYWVSKGLDYSFDEALRMLYYDTCIYTPESLALLFKVVGADRCMLGTERPGDGTMKLPDGTMQDDLKPVIENTPGLTQDEIKGILGETAKKVFTRLAGVDA